MKDGKKGSTRRGSSLRRLEEENRRLNRFRNGVLWGSVYAAALYALLFLIDSARPGRIWEFYAFVLPLTAYVCLFLVVNGGHPEGEGMDDDEA